MKIKDIFETKLFQGKQKAKAIEKCANYHKKSRGRKEAQQNFLLIGQFATQKC